MNVDQEQVNIKNQVEEALANKNTTQAQKNQIIKSIRASRVTGTDSSFKVITSVANTMIGSSMIVFPILFIRDGIIGSLLTLMTVCVIQYLTCRLLVIHNRPDEANFNKQILRILGYRWYVFNSIVNVTLLFFVCIGYYLLIVDNLFMVMQAVFNIDRDSKWVASIIATIICLPMIFMKKIDILLKFFKYTIYCVAAFGIFIACTVVKEIVEGSVNYDKFKFFSSDFSSVAGTFALSFLIHPVAAPILKKNVNQNNNKRDLLFGYILAAFIYFFVGFIGSLSCSDHIKQIIQDEEGQYSTVFACFSDKQTTQDMIFFVAGKIVQFGVLIQNASVMPILHFLTRKQLLDFFKQEDKRKLVFYFQTILFVMASLGTALLQINVSIVLSLDGAIVGFFMAYGIPIYMHLKCYHFKHSEKEKEQIKKTLLENDTQNASLITGLDFGKLLDNEQDPKDHLLSCNKHLPRQKISHLAFYGFILCVGVALGIFKIYALFQ